MPRAGGLGRRLAGSLVAEASADGPEVAVVGADTGVVEVISVFGTMEASGGEDEAGVATLEASSEGPTGLVSDWSPLLVLLSVRTKGAVSDAPLCSLASSSLAKLGSFAVVSAVVNCACFEGSDSARVSESTPTDAGEAMIAG
jgi:hypothetical protein